MSRQNLCINSSCTNNVTGWGGGSTPVRVTGLSGFPVTTGANYTTGTFMITPTGTVSPGVTYTMSMYIRDNGGLGVAASQLYFGFNLSAGGPDESNFVNVGPYSTGVVTRISITAVAPALATSAYLVLDANNFAVRPCHITAVLLEAAASADTFFDGDTPGASWDGTAGNSSSTLTGTTVAADGMNRGLPPWLVQQLAAVRVAQFAPARGAEQAGGIASATLGGPAATATGAGNPPNAAPPPALPPQLVQQLAAMRAAQFTPDRGAEQVNGTAVATLGGLAGAAAGLPTVNGTASATLGGLAAAASGTGSTPSTDSSAPPPALPPSLVQQLAAMRAAQFAPARGAEVVTGAAAASLGGLAAAAAGLPTVNGTASAALGGLAATATGAGSAPAAAPPPALPPSLVQQLAAMRAAQFTPSAAAVVSGTASAALGGLAATAIGSAGTTSLTGEAHGPLPIATGAVVVHTGTIAGAIT